MVYGSVFAVKLWKIADRQQADERGPGQRNEPWSAFGASR